MAIWFAPAGLPQASKQLQNRVETACHGVKLRQHGATALALVWPTQRGLVKEFQKIWNKYEINRFKNVKWMWNKCEKYMKYMKYAHFVFFTYLFHIFFIFLELGSQNGGGPGPGRAQARALGRALPPFWPLGSVPGPKIWKKIWKNIWNMHTLYIFHIFFSYYF